MLVLARYNQRFISKEVLCCNDHICSKIINSRLRIVVGITVRLLYTDRSRSSQLSK